MAVIAFGVAIIFLNIFAMLKYRRKVIKGDKELPNALNTANLFRVQHLFAWNLNIAHILMSGYLSLMLYFEVTYQEEFHLHTSTFSQSLLCKVAGFLFLTSNEASILFILVITADQFVKIRFISNDERLGMRGGMYLVILVWLVALLIGLVGVVNSGGPTADFYDLTDACIGLPLVRRPGDFVNQVGNLQDPLGNRLVNFREARGTRPAWTFSIVVFLVLNPQCLLIALVLFCYILKHAKLILKEYDEEETDVEDGKDTGKAVGDTVHEGSEVVSQVSKVTVKKTEIKSDINDNVTDKSPTAKKLSIRAKSVLEHISRPVMVHMEKKKVIRSVSSKLQEEDKQPGDESDTNENDNKGQGSNNGVDGEFGSKVVATASEPEITEIATPDKERLAEMARMVSRLVFFTLAIHICFVFFAILAQLGVSFHHKLYWYFAVMLLPFPGAINPVIYICRGSTRRQPPEPEMSPEEAYLRAWSWI